ncbi:MAG: hypothetical protein PHE25_05270 [Candidatus Gracilibacteria bacterium]|nr:hypothetical protein [Candidatus Gracilibacteria bacterium]
MHQQEGINNSFKVAKRQSHGFQIKENYIIKIFAKDMISKTKNILFSS